MSEAALSVDEVRDALRLDEAATDWLRALDSIGPPSDPVVLPRGTEAFDLLRRLDVPELDAREIVDALPAVEEDPALRWLLQRHCHKLARDRGDFQTMDRPPSLPKELGAAARYFYVYVYLGAVPAAREYQVAHGVPDDIGWHTLDQLGEMVAIHRRQFGVGGMDKQFWLTLHLRGVIYRLGRLQFNLERTRDGSDHPVLNTHIPAVGGPMTSAACDESFGRAREFFDTHFPEHGATTAICTSWLLDPQLADYLPATSNVVRFMRRWTLTDEDPKVSDESILEFVFRRNDQPLADLPRDTTLERAVLTHLEAGRHWHTPTGHLELP